VIKELPLWPTGAAVVGKSSANSRGAAQQAAITATAAMQFVLMAHDNEGDAGNGKLRYGEFHFPIAFGWSETNHSGCFPRFLQFEPQPW
jgi:hypothetical protein